MHGGHLMGMSSGLWACFVNEHIRNPWATLAWSLIYGAGRLLMHLWKGAFQMTLFTGQGNSRFIHAEMAFLASDVAAGGLPACYGGRHLPPTWPFRLWNGAWFARRSCRAVEVLIPGSWCDDLLMRPAMY